MAGVPHAGRRWHVRAWLLERRGVEAAEQASKGSWRELQRAAGHPPRAARAGTARKATDGRKPKMRPSPKAAKSKAPQVQGCAKAENRGQGCAEAEDRQGQDQAQATKPARKPAKLKPTAKARPKRARRSVPRRTAKPKVSARTGQEKRSADSLSRSSPGSRPRRSRPRPDAIGARRCSCPRPTSR